MKLLNNVRNFVEGSMLKLLNDNSFMVLPIHFKEQVIYRAYLCQDCLSNSECLVCGCKTPAMFYSPHKEDSKGKWSKFMSKVDWDKFKMTNVSTEFIEILNGINGNTENDNDNIDNLSNNNTLDVPITRDFINFVNTLEKYNK